MASFKMRFLQALILALLGSPALATVEPIVTLYGSLEGGSSQASTSQTGRTFLLVVAGNRDELDVTVEVRSGGDLFEGGATVTELRLANGSRVELPVQLTPAAKRDPDQGEALGTVAVRVRSGEDTIKVEFFYVDAKSPGQWELLAPGEYERIIDARVSALLRAAADRRALELALLASVSQKFPCQSAKPSTNPTESDTA